MNMDFLDDLGKAVSDAADTVGKKATEVAELGKLKNKVYACERDIKKGYEDIGKLVYERYKDGSETDGQLEKLCEEIEKTEALIDEYEAEIDDRKKAAKH